VPGVAVTTAPVVALKPVPGDHVYVVAPLAVITTESPPHIPGEGGVTVNVGVGVTVTVTVVESGQPLALVPITVYVVVVAGVAVTEAPVVELNPVGGLHV
jgi:hypothetical protein